jgi:hypothetical protein
LGTEKKVASPNSEKLFSVLILRVYSRESKRITFSHIITSDRESFPKKLYQMGP